MQKRKSESKSKNSARVPFASKKDTTFPSYFLSAFYFREETNFTPPDFMWSERLMTAAAVVTKNVMKFWLTFDTTFARLRHQANLIFGSRGSCRHVLLCCVLTNCCFNFTLWFLSILFFCYCCWRTDSFISTPSHRHLTFWRCKHRILPFCETHHVRYRTVVRAVLHVCAYTHVQRGIYTK